MEGFNTPAAGSGERTDPLRRVEDDILSRCPGVAVYWDDGVHVGDPEVHKLTVIAGDFPQVFPVEHDVLVERGEPYEAFLNALVAQVNNTLREAPPPPPTS
jgi:hypothetical protein